MALWQLKIEVIPTERVRGRTQIDASEFDEAEWWSDRQPPSDYREQLASLLSPTKSWHEQLLWYGANEADRIDVWLEQEAPPKVLPATLPELVTAIADSPSRRFMEDPAHWLPKLAAEVRAADGGK
jgi:hypothetical protein